jgi:lysophospholipase L1-like esterase
MTRLPAVLLAPIVLAQGRSLRRSIPRMPPAEPRTGGSRAAGALRLLVLGDSSAVGTGVEQMTDALAGQIAKRLPEPVAWRVVGANGLRSDEVLAQRLPEAVAEPADLIVLLVGWNDALQMRSAVAFGADLAALLDALRRQNPDARLALGAHVAGLTRVAERVAAERGVALVPGFDGVNVASDRFHPDATGYGLLADAVIAALA